MRQTAFTACALSTALLLSGCSYVTPTITEDEATEKVQQHANNTLGALPENAELEERRGPRSSLCGNPSMLSDEDRVAVGEFFWIRGIPEEDNDTALDLIHDHWIDNGYDILNDNRPGNPFITAKNEKDNFEVAIQYNMNGTLSLTTRSPCLWPEGSPELF